ncbi:MAG: hypothetical protein RIB98_19230 [Acidimicrobiales bacterium]
MSPAGPDDLGSGPVAWDEARELVALVLSLAALLVTVAPILGRVIDGQLDRAGLGSALTGATPTTGLFVLGAAVLVATTPAVDVTPRLRSTVVGVSTIVCLVALLAALDILFSDSSGGVRHFFTRFPTILRFSGPAALLSGTAAWVARRVVPFAGP